MGIKEELEETKKKLEALERKKKEQYKNQNKYIKNNYDRVSLNLPKGEKNNIIEKYGNISINAYICDLIDKDLRGTADKAVNEEVIKEDIVKENATKPKKKDKEQLDLAALQAEIERLRAIKEPIIDKVEEPKTEIEKALNEPIDRNKDALEETLNMLRKKRENGELFNPEKVAECAELQKHFEK